MTAREPGEPSVVPAWLAWTAVAALVAWAFYQRYGYLTGASPYPVGVDGYFYPIQLRSLLDSGALHYPSAPLTLWLMTPLAALTDPIAGAKLGAAAGTALAVAPAYVVGARLGGDRAIGLVAAALVATSAQAFYLSAEFVKNGVAITIYLAFVAALARALDRRTRARIAIATAALLACALAHKTAFALGVVTAVPPVMMCAGRRRALLALAGVGAVAALALAAAVFAPQRFVGPLDARLVSDLFTASADWSLPTLSALSMGHEVALAGLVSLAALAASIALGVAPGRTRSLRPPAGSAPVRALAIGPACVAVFAALPWIDASSSQGLGPRVRLLGFVALALSAAVVSGVALARAGARARAGVCVVVVVAIVLVRPARPDDGVVIAHPAMVAGVRALEGATAADAIVVVPERHTLYMAAWYARVDARLRPPADSDRPRYRLIPGAHLDRPLARALHAARVAPLPGVLPRPLALHPRAAHGLVLVREDTWQHVVRQLPAESRARWERWPTR